MEWREIDWMCELDWKHITIHSAIQTPRVWWRKQLNFTSINHLHSIQKKNNFSFSFHSIDFTCEIDWVELKRYYNSMLKVISWYKLNHKWKTTWIWWKLAGMKWYEFMNGMTFKPLSSNNTSFLFSLLFLMGELKKRSLLSCLRPQAAYKINEWKQIVKELSNLMKWN